LKQIGAFRHYVNAPNNEFNTRQDGEDSLTIEEEEKAKFLLT
jgi:hypothetical protein